MTEKQIGEAYLLSSLVSARLKFLAIDDEPGDLQILRSTLTKILGRDRFSFTGVGTIAGAVDAMRNNLYDAIFLDYDLGDENGLALLQDRQKSTPPAPVVVLTGKGSEEIAADAFRAGVSDYLLKRELSEVSLSQCMVRILTMAEVRRAQFMAESRLAATARGSIDAIITQNLEGDVVGWNEAAETLFGWSAAEMIGQPIARLLPSEKANEAAEVMAAIADGETVTEFDTVRACKNGRDVHVGLSVTPIHDDKGQIVGAATVAHNRSEELLMEDELRRGRHQLAVDNILLKDFSHVIAHDLLDPVRAMMVRLDRLTRASPGDEMLEDARGAAQRLHLMLEGFAKMADLRSTLDADAVDLAPVMDSVRDALADRIEEEDAKIRVGALPRVRGDEAQVQSILQNLVTNAVKYGGDSPVIHVEGGSDGGVAWLRIIDHGPGIPEQFQGNIFRPFERGARHEDGDGAGLGLFLSSVLAQRQGGRIFLEKSDAEGSVFRLEMPAA